MLRIKFILLFIFFNTPGILLKAQSVESIQADKQTYIWGLGTGSTLKAADQTALADMISQISTQVESKYERTVTENELKFKESVNDVVKTFSSATLKNTERIVIQNEPDAKVFRYVKRSEVSKIFEARKKKIIELAHNGEEALVNLQIADALRYFYWSQTFLRSHPESSEITMNTGKGKEALLITWLPEQINQIFSKLSFYVDTVENQGSYSNYLLNLRYNGKGVRNLDYTYWGGQDWSNIVSGKDGTGIVELPNPNNQSNIQLKVEYAFENESNIDMELRDVIQKLPQVPYKNSYFVVNKAGKAPKIKEQDEKKIKQAEEEQKLVKASGPIRQLSNMHLQDSIMQKVVSAIRNKSFDTVRSLFTAEGYDLFQRLLQYGNAQVIKSYELKYFPYAEYVICRSIPMSFNFKTNNRTFIEDVIFYFDKNKKICNITFGLSKKSIEDIASNDNWSEENRILLISFLETYKTAFALKRYDYINKIFSDDALIITGFLTKVNESPESRYINNSIIRYNRLTKTEYLKKLKYSFDSNEFINIRFVDNAIRRSGKRNNVYGIQIRQDYFSTNYGDIGYLFLLVDLSDTLKPQIHVRTWQPEKDSDGTVYGLSDF